MRRLDTALLLLATAAPLAGCEDFNCCNSCGRNYYLVDEDGTTVAWIANIQEGGNECEIGDIPRSFAEDTYTLVVDVAEPVSGPGSSAQVDAGDAQKGTLEDCGGGLPAQPLSALVDAAAGDQLCVVADVTAIEMCTQKACAGSGF